MDTSHKMLLALAALALPVAGAAAHGMLTRAQPLCFTSGMVTYQVSAAAQADVHVRVDNEALRPDIRIRLTDSPENADLILADDQAAGDQSCRTAGAIRTVGIAAAEARPDITVALAGDMESPDVSIYVRSARFSPEHAAALQAAIWAAEHPHRLAGR